MGESNELCGLGGVHGVETLMQKGRFRGRLNVCRHRLEQIELPQAGIGGAQAVHDAVAVKSDGDGFCIEGDDTPRITELPHRKQGC